MKVTIVYGSMRKSSTYNTTKLFLEGLDIDNSDITEFYLPKDCPNFCRGCHQCFDDRRKCPDYKYVHLIEKALDEADLIVFSSPVYLYQATGAMKALFDHLSYSVVPHQPIESMFKKQAIVISTATGGGCKTSNKAILRNFFFMGVGKTYSYGAKVYGCGWHEVSEKRKEKIKREVTTLAHKIKKDSLKKIKPTLKLKCFFYIFRICHQKKGLKLSDAEYWNVKGWLGKKRPWK
ncbi:MAG: flavodoxin family protein [Sarcina sp.]